MAGVRGGGKNQHITDQSMDMAERLLQAILHGNSWADVEHAFRQNRTVTVEMQDRTQFQVHVTEIHPKPEEDTDG